MQAMIQNSLFAVVCIGLVGSASAEPPEEKSKLKIEFRRAETKPADGLTEAKVAGTDEKIYIPKTADATNADIASASVAVDRSLNPAIDVVFTKEGAKKMEVLSEKHKDKPLAIMVDGKVISAPIVREKFTSRAQITGKFTQKEVENIVKAINSK